MRYAAFFTAVIVFFSLAIPFMASVSAERNSSNLTLPDSSLAEHSKSSAEPESSDISQSLPPASSSQSAAQPPKPTGQNTIALFDCADSSVFTVDIEEYLRGAVASEMPAAFHQQALNAQALAAHSWALYSALLQREVPDEQLCGADISVNTARQEGYMTREQFFDRYGDTAELFWPKIERAARYALDRIVTYDGEIALCAYHSMSAGTTEYSENVWQVALPYLIAVESEGDALAPDFEVTETFDKKTMKLLLQQSFPEAELPDEAPEEWIKLLERSESGYVTLCEIGGVSSHGQQLRTALSLRSSCMDISFSPDTFSITTKGYGHGVGMSQYGADFLARQGFDCADILLHYYPGTEIEAVSNG